MKYRTCVLALSSLFLGLLLISFSWLKERCAAPTPIPSHTGGYYEDSFLLELAAPSNGKIYYTTDGSTPTTASTIYQDGILLQDRSPLPNVYNSIANVVSDWLNYEPDLTPVPKGTVIRALFVNEFGMESDILTQTYFVGIPEPERGYTLSLVFEEDALFGDNGIYVTGKEYDDWYLSGGQTSPAPIPNFQQRLIVTAIAELMNESGDVVNQEVSLRLQGNSKRGWRVKRFILEADAALTGTNLIPAAIFPDTATHSLMTKDSKTDAILYDMVSDRAVAAQKSVPVRVYLNGEFLCDWYFLERYDNQYFRQYYDVDNVILVKDGILDEDATIDTASYGELMYWAAHTDFAEKDQWTQIQQEIDLQSYIDYIAINYYLCNWDFSDDKNCILWRSAVEEKSPWADKRWRWCLYDVDALELTLSNYDVENAAEVNIFSCELPYSETKVNETVLFAALSENEAFNRQFVLSFMDIVNNNFAVDKVTAVLEKNGLSIDWMDGFFLKRPAYAAQHLAEEFDLKGSLEPVIITTANPEMGSVVVNTSQIDLSDGSWSGKYFTDYPITVTAIPGAGYEFLGWKGDADDSSETLMLPMDGGLRLEAVFAKAK